MKVLHFIPNFADINESVGLQYKIALIKAMAESAEVHLLCADYPGIDMGSVHVHKFSLLKNLFGRWHSSFKKFLADIRPDVVHIHACWNIYAYYLQRCCEKYRIPTIITFDRQLEAWHSSGHYCLCNFFKSVIYQRYIVSHAKVLHAVCDNEICSISDYVGYPTLLCKILGIRSEHANTLHIDESNGDIGNVEYDVYVSKQNKNIRNIVLIDIFNEIYEKSISPLSDRLIGMYQIVVDSNPFWLMSSEDCCAEDILLYAGATENIAGLQLSDNQRRILSTLDDKAWRRILLHSYNQGILEFVFSGIEKYNLSQPFSQEQIGGIFCLLENKSQRLTNIRNTSKIKTDSSLSDLERDIMIKIMTILYGIKHRIEIKRKDMLDLYLSLKYNNFDEIQLYNKVHETGILKDTARLFQIMKERYGLSEGFMFIEPINDSKTEKLRKMFFKSNIQ